MRSNVAHAYDYSNAEASDPSPLHREESGRSVVSIYSKASGALRAERSSCNSVAGSVTGSVYDYGNGAAIADINCRPIGRHSVVSVDESLSKIEYLLAEPIQCGFLLMFCESQHCSENVSFAIEIDRCKDYFGLDRKNWHHKLTYKEIDALHGVNREPFNPSEVHTLERDIREDVDIFPRASWLSKKVPYETIDSFVKSIWDNYLYEDAVSQICISTPTLVRTARRIRMMHIYGELAFAEALEEPVKTMKRDIQPRFKTSSYFKILKRRLESLHPLPSATELIIDAPSEQVWDDYALNEIDNGMTVFTLKDILHDRVLYKEFFLFLHKQVSTENLLCYRAIDIFDKMWNENDIDDNAIDDWAWTIYRFFVAAGSCYEVSVSYRNRKDIMYSMVKPSPTMFANLKESAILALKEHYTSFRSSSEFVGLSQLVVDHQMQLKYMRLNNNGKGCFNCFAEHKYVPT